MLTAGALRGVLPAGVLSVDDADRLTQASPTPARPISRTSSTGGPPSDRDAEMGRGGSAHELG
jgi:hypothetical protein